MTEDYWGRYQSNEPVTHFDPLHTFLEDKIPVGFRVNFVPGRRKRPREQRLKLMESDLEEPILDLEINNSPLSKVYNGQDFAVVIAGDDEILGLPSDDPKTQDYPSYRGLTIMNKFSPLGLYSKEATGIAMVSFPSTYIRKLNNPQLNFDLLLPMRTSLKHLVEDREQYGNFNTPLIFFNIGPSSGASIRYLHGQSYVVPEAYGLNTYCFRKAFETAFENQGSCLTCKIANRTVVSDHLGQDINYQSLTIWEDEYVKLIYPYAPLRTFGPRLIPKSHVDYLGNCDDNLLKSIAKGLSIADVVMNEAVPSGRKPIVDRTVTFRQTSKFGRDFHLFIDILPPFPFVAAETADYLGLSPYYPTDVAELMRQVHIQYLASTIISSNPNT